MTLNLFKHFEFHIFVQSLLKKLNIVYIYKGIAITKKEAIFLLNYFNIWLETKAHFKENGLFFLAKEYFVFDYQLFIAKKYRQHMSF